MMVPVTFAMLALSLAVAMLVMYLGLQWWIQRQHACYASLPITLHDPHEADISHEPYANNFGGDDSANEQSDGMPPA